MRPGLIIFDCDGVLVDSEPIAARVFSDALNELGLNITQKDVDDRFRGRSLTDCITSLEKELGDPLPTDFLSVLDARTFEAFRAELRAVRGVREALVQISELGVPICVASSGSHQKTELTLGLTELLPFFQDARFSASEVRAGKPAPDLFLFAAKKMGVSAENCVVIEDSLPGTTAGIQAGAQVLAYVPACLTRPLERIPFEKAGAQCFPSMEELVGLLFP